MTMWMNVKGEDEVTQMDTPPKETFQAIYQIHELENKGSEMAEIM